MQTLSTSSTNLFTKHIAAALLSSLCTMLGACGDQQSAPIDGPIDAPVDAPTRACEKVVAVPRATFIAESISYLRASFDGGDFTGGTIRYGEKWVSLNDNGCMSDFSALWYVAPIDAALVPLELRAEVTHVAAVWTLNGLRGVVYLATEQTAWPAGVLPEETLSVAKPTAAPTDVSAFVSSLQTAHPTLAVQWLEAIGVLTISSGISDFGVQASTERRWQVVEVATQKVRASNLFSSVEWSRLAFRLPNQDFPAVTVADQVLYPECLRTHTKDIQDANNFVTLPGLRQPLGTGPIDNPTACQE
jgi:hypothetical protein